MTDKKMKIALASPKLKVGGVKYNTDEIIETYNKAAFNNVNIILFPELAVTGATCGDLFLQKQLYNSNIKGIKRIIDVTKEAPTTTVFGAYLMIEETYYDCIFIAESGLLKGIVPKMKTVSFGGIDFGRWFGDGMDIIHMEEVETELCNYPVAVGDDLVFDNSEFGIDILVKNGSDIFFNDAVIENEGENGSNPPLLVINATADSTQAGHIQHRIDYYNNQSKEHSCFYAYISPGVYESTTDLVFSGQSFITGNGEILSKSDCFLREPEITYTVIDSNKINRTEMMDVTMFSYPNFIDGMIENVSNPLPFIPKSKDKLDEICADAFAIQANALATRLEHVQSKKALVGISGGLDSTLALLVTVEAFKLLKKDIKDIITVTMPGFGTSDRTFDNAISLMKLLGTDLREISIVDSVKQHFSDIDHDIDDKNKAYENAQARERTQILMDIANDVDGIVVGTGDLSEEALGWSTFGGDHLSMYGVNGSIPKTFIPYILNWVADNKEDYSANGIELKNTLKSVIETPISPELLPADEQGEIAQKTEDSVGPYELHDYFIYHTIINKLTPVEILDNAEKAFAKAYNRDTIKKWLKLFYKRFFAQQFKRNCSVEGPMVTHISMSPRGGLVMPSDAVADEWVNTLD